MLAYVLKLIDRARLKEINHRLLLGRWIHPKDLKPLVDSVRAAQPFVAVNCGAIPEALLESELFGHVKGSFTGAYRDKPGKLESAHMGTVFLDEIGEMTLRMQGLLLRFLETGEIQRVGADGGARHVNVRVIGATHRNLREMIAQGTFREDLYYRLNVIQITVPPLRERREDIPELITHFLNRFVAANRCPFPGQTDWPAGYTTIANFGSHVIDTPDGPYKLDCDWLIACDGAGVVMVRPAASGYSTGCE